MHDIDYYTSSSLLSSEEEEELCSSCSSSIHAICINKHTTWPRGCNYVNVRNLTALPRTTRDLNKNMLTEVALFRFCLCVQLEKLQTSTICASLGKI